MRICDDEALGFGHSHGGMQPHEHQMSYDAEGRPVIRKQVVPLEPAGYDGATEGR